MLDLLRKGHIGDTLNRHIAKFVDSDANANRMSQRLLTSNVYSAPLAPFVRSKTDRTIEQKYSTAYATKYVLDTVQENIDLDESPPLNSGIDETPGRKLWRRQSNHLHSRGEA